MVICKFSLFSHHHQRQIFQLASRKLFHVKPYLFFGRGHFGKYGRTANKVESQAVGRRLLGNALHTLGIEPELPSHIVERLLNESSAKTMDDLYAEIGIGTRMAPLVARHIMTMMDTGVSVPQLDPEGHMLPNKPDPVVITGSEGASAQLSSCCMPIPGDRLTGYLKPDQTLIVHTQECETAKRLHEKEPDRWIDLVWGHDLNRRFDCRITILIHNERGTLARIAAEIGESDANIVSVAMDDEGGNGSMKYLRFTIQVEDRVHLARLMRGIRKIDSVARILRERG